MTLRQWVLLLITLLVGLAALFYASGPRAGAAYGIGLVVFGVAVIYAFVLLKQHFDRIDAERH